MVNPLRKLNPSLSKLAAQLVYAKHKAQAEREVLELRTVLAELVKRGKTADELVQVLKAAHPESFL